MLWLAGYGWLDGVYLEDDRTTIFRRRRISEAATGRTFYRWINLVNFIGTGFCKVGGSPGIIKEASVRVFFPKWFPVRCTTKSWLDGFQGVFEDSCFLGCTVHNFAIVRTDMFALNFRI
jgi:hypothetical protein